MQLLATETLHKLAAAGISSRTPSRQLALSAAMARGFTDTVPTEWDEVRRRHNRGDNPVL